MTTITDLDPIQLTLDELQCDVSRAREAQQPWDMPDGPTIALGLTAAERAIDTLRLVAQAIGDLEPAAALIVNEALERGLGATR